MPFLDQSQFDKKGEYKDTLAIEGNEWDTSEDEGETEPTEVNRAMIRAYFHNLIRDECDDEFMYFQDGPNLVEYIPPKRSKQRVFDAASRPR